jgi:hypothetical protein
MPMQPRAMDSKPAIGVVIALVTTLMVVAGCDKRQSDATTTPQPAAAPQPAETPPAPPSAPKPTYTLIMTWISGDQPPQTTQTVFHDLAACDQARDAAIAEGRRLALEALATPAATADKPAPVNRRYVGSALLPSDTAPPAPVSAPPATPPKVAAICAAA